MKKILLLLCVVAMTCISCEKNGDEDYADYRIATPLLIDQTAFRTSVTILPPQAIKESGKIYAYNDYIFVNDKYRGVHIIDNSNPENPQKINFITIPGNVDISIKDDILYADSMMDLVLFDISNSADIRMVKRLEDVLQQYISWPVEADVFDWNSVDQTNKIQIGWETRTERMLITEYEEQFGSSRIDVAFDLATTNEAGNTGQGGSLARFKIVGDFLYAVDSHNINIFEISDLENPLDLEDVYAGFDIETIFNRGEYLFLGSMRGMYIYDISSPDKPVFVSEFQHGTACDPVVVDGDYAYVTLRGGNGCGATESGLFIVDISNIATPELKISYPMDGPYGLGVKDEKLFVCDGESGLKVYDKTDVDNLIVLNHFKDIKTFDVITLEESLVMIGDGVLYQYQYLDRTIRLLSTLNLN